MITILLCFIFTTRAGWSGSRPWDRDHVAMTEIYLDPAEYEVTGSHFESSTDRGDEGSFCDCQGICGYGRGYEDGHVMFANNKMSGAKGCHWCGHGQYDPARGEGDKIVYCYQHKCDDGYISICDQSKVLDIDSTAYHLDHRACTCTKAAGQWKVVPGNYADNTYTTSTTSYIEYTNSITNTHTVAIEQSHSFGIEIEGIGFSSTSTLTEEFSTAIENSWTTGHSTTREVSFHCNDDNKDTAWQYVVYMYDVLCAKEDMTKRFYSTSSGGCAVSAFLMSGAGITCTTSSSEPPCCGPGANPTGVNDRKFCEDDYASWTGQCDGYSSRTRFTSIEDGRINCHPNDCPGLTDNDLQSHLSMCGATCANNGYANTFVPTHVYNAPNMLKCDKPGWLNNFLRNRYCKALRADKHVVALLRRDCGFIVVAGSKIEFDDAYQKAENYAGNKGKNVLQLLPIYYNNWFGECDGYMNRRLLETDEAREVENCKCDAECAKWGDCCHACAEAREAPNDVEGMTKEEWEFLGPLRKTLSQAEFVRARDAFFSNN